MNNRVWTFQYAAEVRKKGADKASWYVGWYDLDGKRHAESCGPGTRGEKEAERRARRIGAELLTGTHEPSGKTKWAAFRAKYEAEILPGLATGSQEVVRASLDHFQRIIRPERMERIKTATIDAFITARRSERGKNKGSKVSPATVNKDLRHIKAALHVANEWGYLPKLPKVRMLREPEKLIQFVTPEHFAVLYGTAADLAKLPRNPDQHYTPAEWWRAIWVTAYMTGWRISELMAMKREDLDLDAATAITRWADNKGKRDDRVPLHPVVVDHLRKIVSFHPLVFRWAHGRRQLWEEFGRIQRAAGIKLVCREKHEHTPACEVYGFHDCRRAYGTFMAEKETRPEALQKLMRHKALSTTMKYINAVGQLKPAVEAMPVPAALRVVG